MATNKENNIKLHGIITKFFNDTILKFKKYYTSTETDNKITEEIGKIPPVDISGKADKTEVFLKDDYEEKEIIVTPAIYGWKTINQTTYAFTDNDFGKKVKITSGDGITSGVLSGQSTNNIGAIGLFFVDNYATQIISWMKQSLNTKVDRIQIKIDGTIIYHKEDDTITKFEIWDIITPAVKAIVLVKKGSGNGPL